MEKEKKKHQLKRKQNTQLTNIQKRKPHGPEEKMKNKQTPRQVVERKICAESLSRVGDMEMVM